MTEKQKKNARGERERGRKVSQATQASQAGKKRNPGISQGRKQQQQQQQQQTYPLLQKSNQLLHGSSSRDYPAA